MNSLLDELQRLKKSDQAIQSPDTSSTTLSVVPHSLESVQDINSLGAVPIALSREILDSPTIKADPSTKSVVDSLISFRKEELSFETINAVAHSHYHIITFLKINNHTRNNEITFWYTLLIKQSSGE